VTLIAFDPGISTGCAVHGPDGYVTAVIKDVPSLWQMIDHHQPSICIYENFSAGGLISKDGQATLRLIGAIEAVCWRLGISTVYQMPSERYGYVPKARQMLQQIKRTPIVHEIDALAHLLLYEFRVEKGIQDALTAKRARLI